MRTLAIAMRRAFFVIFRKLTILFLLLFLLTSDGSPIDKNRAYAQVDPCVPCECVSLNHAITRGVITLEHGVGIPHTDPEILAYSTASICFPGVGTRGWIAYQFCRHREEFIVFYWFREHILAALMMMTEQLVSVAMEQMFIIGSFFDAEVQLDTQLLLQTLAAEAHKDYHPSFEMCEIGTLARSLSNSQRRGEVNTYVLSQHLQDRMMRNINSASAAGKGLDVIHRWEHFRGTFCHPSGNNHELGPRTPSPICAGAIASSRDRDVDYPTTVGWPQTIDVNFPVPAVSAGEERIFALASNLYGHDVFSYFPEAFFENEQNHDEFLHVRSIAAKRSVAQNTFNNIVGMKSFSRANTITDLRPYMELVLEQLGIENTTEAIDFLGPRPSYHAQMEMLTKKLYQRPEFYTGLYDKPVNVERKKAALRAIGLIQNMDLYKSKLRSEAALSVLTEIELQKAQSTLQDTMNFTRGTGIK